MRDVEKRPDGKDALEQEVRHLRACLSDLVALGALPATWTGRDAPSMAASLADGLLDMLHAELVFVRLDGPAGVPDVRIVRAAAGALSAERERQVAEALGPLLEAGTIGSPMPVAGMPGGVPLFLTLTPLGHGGKHGFVVAGSAWPGFPDDFQRTLLRIGSNQLAFALKERPLQDRKRGERALRENEERFRTAFAHASVGMAVMSLEGRFLHVNPALCDITGYDEAEMLATDFQSITHPEDVRGQTVSIRRMLAAEIPGFVIAKRYVRKDGGIVWVQNSVTLARDAAGEPRTLLALVEDVTVRKHAEDALRESERRFGAVFDGALDAMVIVNDDGRYVEANAAACALLGRSREAILGESIVSTSAPGMDFERVWEAFRREGRATGQWRFVQPDGTVRDVEYTGKADIVPGLHLGVMRDVTERTAAEVELRRKTELLETVFDNMPCMFNVLGPGVRPMVVNREWTRVLGWTAKELEGRDLLALVYTDPEERRRTEEFIEAADRSWRDFHLRTKDGREIDASWANFRLSDGTMIGIGQDVTERKRVEKDRERRAAQLQALADAALAIGAAGTLAEIARLVTEAARRVIGAHAAITTFTLDERRARLICARSLSDEHAAHDDHELGSQGSGVRRLVRETNRPLRLTEAELLAHPAWPPLGEGGGGRPLRSLLAVPLIARDGGNLGVIELSDKYEGAFGADDEAILVQLAQLASQAAERARLLGEVSAARERLETLSRRLVNLQEEERRTIARELHDEVGQALTGLKLMVETSHRGGAVDLGYVQELTNQLLARIRDLSLNLRPPMLDDLGLVPTLLWHFERYRAQTRIEVRFHHRGVKGRFPAATEIAAFRIIQEALTNVARHAGVTEARVELSVEGRSLTLRVEDKGRGFDPAALPGASSGLTGLRERALLAGGFLSHDSRPGAGTRLLAVLPLPARSARKR
jgi:PAS domain S-box-containing protein